MGAAASISDFPVMPIEMAQLYQRVLAQQQKLVEIDAQFMIKEKNKMFRKNQDLIKLVTNRSKTHMTRVMKAAKMTAVDVTKMGGSVFGKFLGFLCMDRTSIDFELLAAAASGVGKIDEMWAAQLFGVMATSDIRKLGYRLSKIENGITIEEKLSKKMAAGSSFHTLLLGMLACDRPDVTIPDVGWAAQQAEAINSALSGEVADDNRILENLCYQSRAQCFAIATAFYESYGRTLNKDLSAKYSAGCAMLINLWILPIDQATASLLTSAKSLDHLILFITRFEKSALVEANAASVTIFQKSLPVMLKPVCKGKIAEALFDWIGRDNCYAPDEGKLTKYIETAGFSVANIVADSSTYTEVMQCLQTLATNYTICLGADDINVASLPPWEPFVDGFSEQYQEPYDYSSEQLTSSCLRPSQSVPKLAKCGSLQMLLGDTQADDDDVVNGQIVEKFLRLNFKKFDFDHSGELETEEFWKMVNGMRLTSLGFTPEELDVLRELCDWDSSGTVSLEEALTELTDSIVNAIQSQGWSVRQKVASLIEVNEDLKRLDDEHAANQVLNLAPDLHQFLGDTFTEYDVDKNGVLDSGEFWKLISAMNLGLTDADFASIMTQWDTSRDGNISWDEAIVEFTRILSSMAADGLDHWIGLFDKQSQNLYWYNVRDGTSEWMSEADQELYRASSGSYSRSGY